MLIRVSKPQPQPEECALLIQMRAANNMTPHDTLAERAGKLLNGRYGLASLSQEHWAYLLVIACVAGKANMRNGRERNDG
jgi:hypothetical protein